MASILERPPGSGQWLIRFRPPFNASRRTRRIVPRRPCRTRAEAQALADECDRYCRLIETGPTRDDVLHAQRIGAITAADAARYLGGAGEDPLPGGSITLAAAAGLHPATRREQSRDLAAARAHGRQLAAYCAWAGSDLLRDVTLSKVLAYVEALRGRGLSWDTRRHHLLWLRRACHMGPTLGLPNALVELQLDRRGADEAREVAVWTGPEIAAAYAASLAAGRLAHAVAIGLHGFLGLRASEAYRLLPQDVDLAGAVLRIGRHGAKNAASVRDLPFPGILAAPLGEIVRQRADLPAHLPILHAEGGRHGRRPWTGDAYSAWLRPWLDQVLPHHLKPSALRASWATWAIQAGIEPRHVEAIMGHQASGVLPVTARHYLAAARVAELRPVVARLDEVIRGWQCELSHKP